MILNRLVDGVDEVLGVRQDVELIAARYLYADADLSSLVVEEELELTALPILEFEGLCDGSDLALGDAFTIKGGVDHAEQNRHVFGVEVDRGLPFKALSGYLDTDRLWVFDDDAKHLECFASFSLDQPPAMGRRKETPEHSRAVARNIAGAVPGVRTAGAKGSRVPLILVVNLNTKLSGPLEELVKKGIIFLIRTK